MKSDDVIRMFSHGVIEGPVTLDLAVGHLASFIADNFVKLSPRERDALVNVGRLIATLRLEEDWIARSPVKEISAPLQ